MKFFYRWRSYFTFPRRQRNGIFLLTLVILLVIGGRIRLCFDEPEAVTDFSEFIKEAEALRGLAEKQQKRAPAETAVMPARKKELFYFDPNHLSEEKWRKLGLMEKQIRVIKNYEAKGGKFYRREDLKKIYGVTPEIYASLEPYIIIKRDTAEKYFHGKDERKSRVLPVEMNTADSAALVSLKGIGPVFASRIIRYRNRLGGFHNIEQLREVYGMDSLFFDQVRSQVIIDSLRYTRLDINREEAAGLMKHPYISKALAHLMVAYRHQHGNYKRVEDLKKLHLVNEELYRKIAPYLTTGASYD